MSVRRILLAVSTSRYSEHLVDHAMEAGKKLQADGAAVHIDVLYIIEREDLDRIGKMVGDDGFLGLSPQGDIVNTLGEEHNRMALRRVDEVRNAADAHGFAVTVHRVEGRFVDEVLGFAKANECETILITRAERPFISRILFGSAADKVARLARKTGLKGTVIIDEAD